MVPVRMRLVPSFLLAAAALLCAPRADARSCLIQSLTPLSFGGYDGTSTTPADAMAQMFIECTGSAPFEQMQILLGRGLSGHLVPREMRFRDSSLAYNLFLDASRIQIWGDGTNGTSTYVSSGLEGLVTVTVYGRVFPRQIVRVGSYHDQVLVTVLF
jgi:spore coat protein U-like protein